MGKIYACSDIHGQYEKYMKLWDIVTDEDELFIIGDVIDRGPDGMRILTDVMERENITFILGNHECMMYHALFKMDDTEDESNDYMDTYDADRWFEIWTQDNNGGMKTYKDFDANYRKSEDKIAEFLERCPVMADATARGKKYVFAHGMPDMDRLGEKAYEKVLRGKGIDPIVWDSPFDILKGAAPIAVKEGRVMELEDRLDYPLMDLQSVPRFMKPPMDRWESDITYIVGHVIVQRLGSPKMIHMPLYDNVSGDEKVVEFLGIDGGLAAYRNYGQGGLLDSLSLILYSLSDDEAIYL